MQIPFLLNIALAVTDYMSSFDFVPKATIPLLQKLDCAFSSLMHGQDVTTGDPLPGFESGRRITVTEKIRLQGLVERTRVQLVDIAKRGGVEEYSSNMDYEATTTADESEATEGGLSHYSYPAAGEVDLDVARAYERTLADLSDSLDSGFG